jgi:hypothetical protein
MRAAHCQVRDGPFCLEFLRDNERGNGQDLGTVLFYRQVEENDPCNWTIDLPGRTTTWAITTAIPNVNQDNPIRQVSGISCDKDWDSVFPSVFGDENDVLLLSQAFDDTAVKNQFQPPDGTDLLGFTNSYDEVSVSFAPSNFTCRCVLSNTFPWFGIYRLDSFSGSISTRLD